MGRRYDVAAYIWPAYTGDEPRTRIFWPEGMGEWQTVRDAAPKFPGHEWPRRPLWGYVNEADPYVMEMEINAAADHGVNVFIYDWYWYDRRPFLENCLNDGFLKAKNRSRMKFYLMWANHNVNNTWDIRNSDDPRNLIWDGAVDRAEFERIGRRLIAKYFCLDAYYRIDGRPVFEIYDIQNLVRGLGGVQAVKEAFSWFREEAVRAGLPGLHLQLTLWGEDTLNLSGVDTTAAGTPAELAKELGFDSLTHYQFVHFTNVNRDYREIVADARREWERIEAEYPMPYFPHVSVGWDANPRYRSLRPEIVKNNTPEAFAKALQMAKDFLDAHPERPPLVTINSWNEWTETSYLQPDDRFGYGCLQAVKRIFAPEDGE